MKIAIAQMNVVAGQIETNLMTMKQMIDQAKLEAVDFIVFPEMCVTGYVIGDRFLQSGFQEAALQANQRIINWSKDMAILWGNLHHVEAFKSNRDGRRNRYNAAHLAVNGAMHPQDHGFGCGVYVKHCMPDYRIFDDSRYFKSALEVAFETSQALNFNLKPFKLEINQHTLQVGVEICEDLWSASYAIQPTDCYVRQSVDLIVNISSSPYTLGKEVSREKRILEQVQRHQDKMVPILYVNAVGMQNNGKNVILFDGDSTLYSANGQAMVQCNDRFEQELRVMFLGDTQPRLAEGSKLLDALVSAIRLFDQTMFQAKVPWIIGLSGGIDSCVNAALLVLALGKERVHGYNMASCYNQETSIEMARKLALTLDIQFEEGSIESLVQSTLETLESYHMSQVEGLAFENIQARIRGHLLSSFASVLGGVIINNGNKVELALGYATLYGDTIGALSPLGDLTKLQIFELAKMINQTFQKEVIDHKLIPHQNIHGFEFGFAPSAELKDNQVDPMKWGVHDYLVQYLTEYPTRHPVEYLRAYVSGAWEKWPIAAWMRAYGLDDPSTFVEDYRWFTKAWHQAVFKRIQFPPIVMLSRGAFGFDYRESQLVYEMNAEELALIDELVQRKGAQI
jgi:NAD+ synthase (glutamine-hydrolysing)